MTLLHLLKNSEASASVLLAFSRKSSTVSLANEVWCENEHILLEPAPISVHSFSVNGVAEIRR